MSTRPSTSRTAALALVVLAAAIGVRAQEPDAQALLEVSQEEALREAADGLVLDKATAERLQDLQDLWLKWSGELYQGDEGKAKTTLADLEGALATFGLNRFPDLSIGAAYRALELAEEGSPDRARWALDGAEVLDPGRPEANFAWARIQWGQGHFVGAAFAHLEGWKKVWTSRWLSRFWTKTVTAWFLLGLVVTALIFWAVQAGVHGAALAADMRRGLGAQPAAVRGLFIAVLLLWPLLLPGRALWLPLYWSVLFWGYGSVAERWVTGVGWVLVAGVPVVLAGQQQSLDPQFQPPVRALESVRQGRLYGGLFTELSTLELLLPGDLDLVHLEADVHRKIGQWERARSMYRAVLAADAARPGALNDLAIYYFRQGEMANAVSLLNQAAEVDPTDARIFFNLSQAHSEAYQFDEQRAALETARQLSSEDVDRWIANPPPERVVAFDAGIEGSPQLLARLDGSPVTVDEPLGEKIRTVLPVTLVLVLGFLAWLLHRTRTRLGGYAGREGSLDRAPGLTGRLWRWLMLGWVSVERGQAIRAFLAIWPVVALLLLPFGGRAGFALPLGIDPGAGFAMGLAGAGVAIILAIRWPLARGAA